MRSTAPGPPGLARKLPQPLKIPTIATLRTLGDIRALLGRLPAERRQQDRLNRAAHRGDVNDAVIALRFVLQLEPVPSYRNEAADLGHEYHRQTRNRVCDRPAFVLWLGK